MPIFTFFRKSFVKRCFIFCAVFLVHSQAQAFWVVNFGTASTLFPGKFGFAAGLGGQVVLIGDPQRVNAFFMIPHAGFRLGLTETMDIGLRMAPVPLPFASVGPGFGMNIDTKIHFTKREDDVQFALVLGAGAAHVLIQDNARFAWTPNVAALSTFRLNKETQLTAMGRFVHLQIPTAVGGASGNFVNISGASIGLRREIAPSISILPEVGAYWYEGQIGGARASGPGFQYGVMIATSF
jgi:hypothetical protein